jgi:hypothetical protein
MNMFEIIKTRRMLRYAPRFHGKNRKKNYQNKIQNKVLKNFKKKFQKKMLKKNSKKKLCLNSYACNRGSASENFWGLGPLV